MSSEMQEPPLRISLIAVALPDIYFYSVNIFFTQFIYSPNAHTDFHFGLLLCLSFPQLEIQFKSTRSECDEFILSSFSCKFPEAFAAFASKTIKIQYTDEHKFDKFESGAATCFILVQPRAYITCCTK